MTKELVSINNEFKIKQIDLLKKILNNIILQSAKKAHPERMASDQAKDRQDKK